MTDEYKRSLDAVKTAMDHSQKAEDALRAKIRRDLQIGGFEMFPADKSWHRSGKMSYFVENWWGTWVETDVGKVSNKMTICVFTLSDKYRFQGLTLCNQRLSMFRCNLISVPVDLAGCDSTILSKVLFNSMLLSLVPRLSTFELT